MIRASLTGFRLTAGLLPLLAGASAFGQDDEDKPFDRTPQDCVIVSTIDQTDAIDDQNIIFRMRGNKRLSQPFAAQLPRLGAREPDRVRDAAQRGCAASTRSRCSRISASSFRPGFTCRLGEFVPLSPAEVEDSSFARTARRGKAPSRRARSRSSATTRPPIRRGRGRRRRRARAERAGRREPPDAEN